MIKKFKEFVEDVSYGITPERNIRDTIPEEEVEDQFLRLKEVLNYNIIINYHNICNAGSQILNNYYIIRVSGNKKIPLPKEELNMIKMRIENIYPSVKMTVLVRTIGVDNGITSGLIASCYIYKYNEGNKIKMEGIINRNKATWKKLED